MKASSIIPIGAILGVFLAVVPMASAETYQISWDAVTTYTDGTSIPGSSAVTYNVYWTTDSGLAQGLHGVATSSTATSATFDPGTAGMTRGQTIYFTARTQLSTGEQSSLSTGFSWVVPAAPTSPPPPPGATPKVPGTTKNMRIIRLN